MRSIKSAISFLVVFVLIAACAAKESGSSEREIMSAIQNNDTEALSDALSQETNLDFHQEDGLTPLSFAAFKGNKEAVHILLDNEADPNFDGGTGIAPLGVAIDRRMPEIAALLLKAGANANTSIIDGRAHPVVALLYAYTQEEKEQYVELAESLIWKGVNLKYGGSSDISPIEMAMRYGFDGIAKALVCRNVSGSKRKVADGLYATVKVKRADETNSKAMYEVKYDDGIGSVRVLSVYCND